MKAVLLHRHGSPDVLRPTVIADPTPGPGDVLVRTGAIGINYAEIQSRKGLYGWAPSLPYVLGMECAGVIEALGPGVGDRAVGDEVVVGTQYGAYAERIVVPAARALPALPDLTQEENAAFAVNWMTAWVGLVEMARLRPADRVSVSPAGGGVGTAAVQLAKAWGCEVVAMAGSDGKLERVRRLGADAVVNYRRTGWQARLGDVVGERGLDVALEMVGGEVFLACRNSLAPLGRVVVAGYASLDYTRLNPASWWRAWRGTPRMGVMDMAASSTGMLASHLGYLLGRPEVMSRVWRGLTGFVLEHGLRPEVGHVLPFEQVSEAHRLIESRESYGKVVLRMES